MDIEVERGQCLAATQGARVRKQQVGAKADKPVHRIGLLVKDSSVDLIACHELPPRRAQRPLRYAERLGALAG